MMISSKQERYPLRINVGFLLNQAVGTYRDIHIDLEKFQFSSEFSVFNISGKIRVGRTKRGIFVQSDFTAYVPVICARCLDEYSQLLEISFGELYGFKREDVTDLEFVLPDDANIDLAPLVYEYLILELPISPLCSTGCQGLCPICGQNFNEAACEHMERVIEARRID